MTRLLASAAILGAMTTTALAEPMPYKIDPAHSEIVFSWSHAGFSDTNAIIFDISGELMFDPESPENSSVNVTIPVDAIVVTPEFEQHLFQSGDFFPADPEPITFKSTSINVTGDNTAEIVGDMTINGQTNEVTLETTLQKQGEMMGNQNVGFEATTTIDRTQYGLGAFAPTIPAELPVQISIEASPSDGSSQ